MSEAMNSLLQSVTQAHRGLHEWSEFSDLVTDVALRGRFFGNRGWKQLSRSRVLFSLRVPHTIINLSSEQGTIVLEPGLVSSRRGIDFNKLTQPKGSLRTSAPEDWDTLRAAYFMGYALRQVLTAPFIYPQPGVTVKEVAPWTRSSEQLRGMQITSAGDLDLPFQEYTVFCGQNGLMRSLYIRATVLGGIDLAGHITAYSNVEGFMLPQTIHIYAGDSTLDLELARDMLGQLTMRHTLLPDPNYEQRGA